jgi:Tfp pilus assembly protein PilN
MVPISSSGGLSLQSIFSKLKISRGGGSSNVLTPENKTLLIQIVLLLLVAYAGNFYVTDYQQKQLRALDSSRADLQSKLRLIDSEIGKTAGYEKLKKDLEADELQVRKKIETIQKVITNRSDAPKILLRVSDVIPKNVWLTDLKVEEKSVKMNGIAISFEDYADFSKKLEGIELFSKVSTIGGINQVQQDNVQVYRFGLDIVRR